MTSIGYLLKDERMPRTIYWNMFLEAVKKIRTEPEKTADGTLHYDLFIPYEDAIGELNWPKHSTTDITDKADFHETNYLRGNSLEHFTHEAWTKGIFKQYISQIINWAVKNPTQRVWMASTHSWFTLAPSLQNVPNVYYSPMNLEEFQRNINPNCFCWPLMPIVRGDGGKTRSATPRHLASFVGVISHHTRQKLSKIHDGEKIVVQIAEHEKHKDMKLDALKQNGDPEFIDLMQNSTFALVPRGDTPTSYRLTEAMSFGAIPIIISDEAVLPFDRTVPWSDFSLRVSSDRIKDIPGILKSIKPERIATMQKNLNYWFGRSFSSLEAMIRQGLLEIEAIDKAREQGPQT